MDKKCHTLKDGREVRDKPPITVKNLPKDRVVHIRCTQEHFEMLKKAAEEAKFPMSTWILYAALNYKK